MAPVLCSTGFQPVLHNQSTGREPGDIWWRLQWSRFDGAHGLAPTAQTRNSPVGNRCHTNNNWSARRPL